MKKKTHHPAVTTFIYIYILDVCVHTNYVQCDYTRVKEK